MEQKQEKSGVYTGTKKDGSIYYRASLTYRKKHISLGSFSSAEEAHSAYLEGCRILEDLSVSLISYHSPSALPFEKWVILLNFRDNGLYIGKPIYLGQKQFSYYLSPAKILKFDLDDLFYYSSHKIMCRGNHYFVADYGMQVSIISRYGIKNYAVEGKDYVFLNGDSLDFRRVNLKILNQYHGVSLSAHSGSEKHHLLQQKEQCLYTARIHIHGNYVIGHYSTALEAAVAYNKAIDILQKNGLKKNFQPNYIDSLSPREYAELYTRLKISPRILSYRPTFPNNPES